MLTSLVRVALKSFVLVLPVELEHYLSLPSTARKSNGSPGKAAKDGLDANAAGKVCGRARYVIAKSKVDQMLLPTVPTALLEALLNHMDRMLQ